MHHRQEGRFLSEIQEMTILVGGFGLFVLGTPDVPSLSSELWSADCITVFPIPRLPRAIKALLVAQRALSEQTDIGYKSPVARVPEGLTGKRPFPCSPDAIACIVEEWSWF